MISYIKAKTICIKVIHIVPWIGDPSDPLILSETRDDHSSAIVRWTVGDDQMDNSDENTNEHRETDIERESYSCKHIP